MDHRDLLRPRIVTSWPTTKETTPSMHRLTQRSSGSAAYGPAKPLYASATSPPSPSTFTWTRHYCVVDIESHGYSMERICGPSSKERLLGDPRIHLLPLYRLVTVYKTGYLYSLGRTMESWKLPSLAY